jgi:ATP-dependent Clp protease ATP-binding subunit ClpC
VPEAARAAQAIDLIDEAGSRVRLRHAQLPEEARELDKELRALLKEKDAAVRGQARRALAACMPRMPSVS